MTQINHVHLTGPIVEQWTTDGSRIHQTFIYAFTYDGGLRIPLLFKGPLPTFKVEDEIELTGTIERVDKRLTIAVHFARQRWDDKPYGSYVWESDTARFLSSIDQPDDPAEYRFGVEQPRSLDE